MTILERERESVDMRVDDVFTLSDSRVKTGLASIIPYLNWTNGFIPSFHRHI